MFGISVVGFLVLFFLGSIRKSGPEEKSSLDCVFNSLSFYGIEMKDCLLGSDESVTDATKETLQFDEYRYVEVTTHGHAIFLFVSYWKSSDFNLKNTSGHNPDNCWSRVGGWSELKKV